MAQKKLINRQEHSFTDDYGVQNFYYVTKSSDPRAVLLLAHGLGEYSDRYTLLEQELAERGITSYSIDHRGHGKTGATQHGGDLTKLGRLGPGGLRATIANLSKLTEIIKAENPELPIIYFGHSWGSLMGQILLNTRSADYVAAVLSGTAYRVPGEMNSGDLNKRHKHLGKTGYEWLSRDEKVSEQFLADPLCFSADVLKLFGVADGLRLFGRPAKKLANLPILIQVGSDDPLGGSSSALKLAESYRKRSGLSDVELKIYQDARHEIYNETNQQEVRTDLYNWIDRILKQKA